MLSDRALVQCEILKAFGIKYKTIANKLGVSTQALYNSRIKNEDKVNHIREMVMKLMIENEFNMISENMNINKGVITYVKSKES